MRALVLAGGLALVLASLGHAQQDEARAGAIARAVERLGHPQWRERERASDELWRFGADAEVALRAAMGSRDREVALRAGSLVELIDWCITPATGADAWKAVLEVRATRDPVPRAVLVAKLLDRGRAVYPAVIGLLRVERDPELRRGIATAILHAGPLLREWIATSQPVAAARLLDELAMTGEDEPVLNHVAYHLVRGTLAAEITRLAGDPSPSAPGRVYLLRRAAGDLDGAAEVARTLATRDARTRALVDVGAWKDLLEAECARRIDQEDAASHGMRAALAALAGQAEPRAQAVASLLAVVGVKEQHAGEKLVALGEVARLLPAIAAQQAHDWRTLREAILFRRHDYEAVLEVPADADRSAIDHADRARVHAILGKGEEADAEIGLALEGASERVRTRVFQRMGAARAPAVVRRHFLAAYERQAVGEWGPWLVPLWPDQPRAATALWGALVARRPNGTGAAIFDEHFAILDGRADPDAVVALAREAAPGADSDAVADLAETCRRAGRGEAGVDLLQAVTPAGEVEANRRFAQLAVRSGLWARAEMASRWAYDASPYDSAAMLLRIEVLDRLGRRDEARVLIERARHLALATVRLRLDLASVLERLGRVAEARQVLAETLRTTIDVADCEKVARTAWQQAPDDDVASLDQWIRRLEVHRLSTLASPRGIDTFAALGRAQELAIAHGIRARLDGRKADAIAYARAAIEIDPYDDEANALYQSVAEPAEAARVRDTAFRFHDAQLARYPASGHVQNQWAWFAARVRMRLPDALRSAERAVELEPGCRYYFDTLAEVRFQMGDRAGALAAIDRALLIDPERGYYHRQRRRFAEGDPASEPK